MKKVFYWINAAEATGNKHVSKIQNFFSHHDINNGNYNSEEEEMFDRL